MISLGYCARFTTSALRSLNCLPQLAQRTCHSKPSFPSRDETWRFPAGHLAVAAIRFAVCTGTADRLIPRRPHRAGTGTRSPDAPRVFRWDRSLSPTARNKDPATPRFAHTTLGLDDRLDDDRRK